MTDFYLVAALKMLQSLHIIEERLTRRAFVDARYDRDMGPLVMMLFNLYQ